MSYFSIVHIWQRNNITFTETAHLLCILILQDTLDFLTKKVKKVKIGDHKRTSDFKQNIQL